MVAMLRARALPYSLLLAAGLILFMANLGGPSLWDLDEGRNATAALEMLESGNYVVPTFNGQLRADKPALLYWLQIASYQVFGINEFAVRFPSALAALATLFICYELGLALFCPSTALMGGLILASSAMMMGAGHFANPDALLNLFVVFVLTVFWRGQTRPTSAWFVGMGILMGLGALAKGPVGVLLPGLIIIVFLVWEKRLSLLRDRRVGYGILALALVALPWYVWVAVETRGLFLRGFLGEHNWSRFLTPMDKHTGLPYYYIVVLLAGMTPWSVLLIFGSWYGLWSMVRVPWFGRENWWRFASDNTEPGAVDRIAAYRFLGVWLGCYLLFFTLAATKLPNYLLPISVPCALLTARFLQRWRLGKIRPSRWVIPFCLAGMAALGVATGLGLAMVSGNLPCPGIAGPFIGGMELWGLFGLVPIMAAILGYWNLRRQNTKRVVHSFFIGTYLFVVPLVVFALPIWNRIKAPRSLVEETETLNRHEDMRIGGFHLEHLPSLNFYTQREVTNHRHEDEVLAFLRYPLPVYLFLPGRIWENLKVKAPPQCRLVAHHPDFYRFSDIVVITNHPIELH